MIVYSNGLPLKDISFGIFLLTEGDWDSQSLALKWMVDF